MLRKNSVWLRRDAYIPMASLINVLLKIVVDQEAPVIVSFCQW